MAFTSQEAVPTEVGDGASPSAARRVAAAVYAAQGAAVAAVFTTIPAVQQRLGLSSLLTTVLMVGVSLAAGVGSFAGLAAIRRLGPVAVMRGALLAAATALLLIGWAADQASAIAAYLLFGVTLGAIDVSVNTRAAAIERAYGRSIFSSFYASWSAGGVVAALLTAGMAHLGWGTAQSLTVQAAVVVAIAAAIRHHSLPYRATPDVTVTPLGHAMWRKIVPLGVVLLVAYIVDSTVSAWSTVYLHQALAASLPTAPLAYAAYQAGTITGRACADRLIRRIGPSQMVRAAATLTALAMAALAAAPSWPYAIPAAGLTGLGASALIPLCFASAGRLQPEAAEAVLARLNLFNYIGVICGAAASGVLGSTGHFRLAYAIPAALALIPLAAARMFSHPARLRAGHHDPSAPDRAHPSGGGNEPRGLLAQAGASGTDR